MNLEKNTRNIFGHAIFAAAVQLEQSNTIIYLKQGIG